MKYFLEMIESARLHGVFAVGPSFQVERFNHISLFWKAVEECHPFVLTSDSDAPVVVTQGNILKPKIGPALFELDSPFKSFSVEYDDGKPLKIYKWKNENRDEIKCILTFELGPKEFGFFILSKENQKSIVFASNAEKEVIEKIISRINKEKTGLEKVRQKIKIGTGSEKRFHIISKIIHIRPNKIDYPQSENHRQIDWTHRWFVRGHWRKHEGLGKNREGVYCIHGYTWVTEFEKGPKDLPLVKKVRIVDNGSNDGFPNNP